MPLTLAPGAEHFITLAEVKAQANITSSTHDAELTLFLGAAEEAVEGLIGPVLQRQVTETHTMSGGSILLRQWPILSVTAVTSRGVPTEYEVNPEIGEVWARAFGPVTVTYTVGRTVVPDSIRVAALIIAEHLWTTQRGAAPAQFADDLGTPAPGMAYSIPNRATDLLRPYLLPPVVG